MFTSKMVNKTLESEKSKQDQNKNRIGSISNNRKCTAISLTKGCYYSIMNDRRTSDGFNLQDTLNVKVQELSQDTLSNSRTNRSISTMSQNHNINNTKFKKFQSKMPVKKYTNSLIEQAKIRKLGATLTGNLS